MPVLPAMPSPAALLAKFRETFAGEIASDAVIGHAAAPGRLNVGSAHTDWAHRHCMGFALAGREVHVLAARAQTPGVRAVSLTHPGDAGFAAYVAGALAAVAARLGTRRAPGVCVLAASTLPAGTGLSSSAALVLACVQALAVALAAAPRANENTSANASAALPARDACALGFAAETQHVGVLCGLLDYLCCGLARAGHYLLIDCAVPYPPAKPAEPRAVRAPATAHVAVAVIDTGTSRRLAHAACSRALAPSVPPAWARAGQFNLRVKMHWAALWILHRARPALVDPRRRVPTVCADTLRGNLCDAPRRYVVVDARNETAERDALAQMPDSLSAAAAAAADSIADGVAVVVWDDDDDDNDNDNDDVNDGAEPRVERRDAAERVRCVGVLPPTHGFLAGREQFDTAPLFAVLQYMANEDERIRALAAVLEGEMPAAPSPEHGVVVRELEREARCTLDDECKYGDSSSKDRGARARRVRAILALVRDGGCITDPLDRRVVEGVLGDASWRDKRDLFVGDGDASSLDKAYATADRVARVVREETGDEWVLFGRIGAGAGWAGMAPVYFARRYVPLLRLALNGAPPDASELATDGERRAAARLAQMPAYADDAELIAHAGLVRDSVDCWIAEPGDGVHVVGAYRASG